MEQKINTHIPVIFQELEEYKNEDIRFIKVKIWLMHTGVNLNGSSFSKEVTENAIPTLANTPILAFIEENSNNELDFSDHRMVLHKKEDGELIVKYLGQAVGVIPETNNAHWEKRVTDSGEEKEYLVVEGLMWTKWDEPLDIMKRKQFTSQSMELSDQYTGHFDENGIFHFDSFSFFGACLLGDDVLPAMVNSTAEVQFSENKTIQNNIENKLNEFYTLFSQEGGKSVEEVKQNFEEQVTEIEETKEVSNENVEEVTETDNPVEQTFEQVAHTEETVEEVSQEFSLTSQQLIQEIRGVLGKQTHVDRWGDTCRNYWYVDHTDSAVIFENVQDGYQLYQASYTLNGDNVTIDFDKAFKVKIEYVPFEGESVTFSSKFERFESEKSHINLELESLQSYKRQREEQDLRDKFAHQVSEDEFKELFSNNKSLEDIEVKIYALIGKKNFSLLEEKPSNKIAIKVNKDVQKDNPYGNFFE